MSATVTPLRRPEKTDDDRFLSPLQVCELVPGMTVANLEELRKSGRGPRYYKPTGERGRVIVYVEGDVRAWVKKSLHTTREQS